MALALPCRGFHAWRLPALAPLIAHLGARVAPMSILAILLRRLFAGPSVAAFFSQTGPRALRHARRRIARTGYLASVACPAGKFDNLRYLEKDKVPACLLVLSTFSGRCLSRPR
ncbi:uncharacterized protein F5Z01DRAFT_388714 [Emericellopsis atlantica]|uniref:Uncharacterized protein n=1 Tax=Emericellopsis atlantica TaxID=2614577 RepID=A0A9P7ZSC8_9HYPO|nr:uncharacterized protein F5Z01DRAFT_388714 [Emericellopsis atlantica]KAG9257434.1 hypothetical protein F5Z01DRAFT_388714 [Emericellopsis atlantica]